MPDRRKVGEAKLVQLLADFPAGERDPFTASPSIQLAVLESRMFFLAEIYGARDDLPRAFAWIDLAFRSSMMRLESKAKELDGWKVFDDRTEFGQDDRTFLDIAGCTTALRLTRRQPNAVPSRPFLEAALRWQERWFDHHMAGIEAAYPGKKPARYVLENLPATLAGLTLGAMGLRDSHALEYCRRRMKDIDDWHLQWGKSPEEMIEAKFGGWFANRLSHALMESDVEAYNKLDPVMWAAVGGSSKSIGRMFSLGSLGVRLLFDANGGDGRLLRLGGLPEGLDSETWWQAGRQ